MVKKRCRVCGYLLPEKKIGEVCPACGVPSGAFEEYHDKLSARRRKILDYHLHGMVLHFPQAIVVLMLLLLLAGFIFSGSLKTRMATVFSVLAVLLPFSVAGGLVSGMLEGKTRFKRLNTPILKFKIFTALIFLASSLAVMIFVIFFPQAGLFWHLGLTTLGVVSSILLGNKGSTLQIAELPG